MTWWERLKTWLGWSKPVNEGDQAVEGSRRERLEIWIEKNSGFMNAMHDSQEKYLASYGRYQQVLGGGPGLPDWATFRVDVYEAPGPTKEATVHGFFMVFSIVETDGSKWFLSLDPSVEEHSWIKYA